MRRQIAGAVAALALVAALAGCASEPEPAVTVTFTLDGAEQTVTMHPDSVTCDGESARGISLGNDPQGSFAFRVGEDGTARASVGMPSDAGLVSFESDDVDLELGDGRATVRQSRGEVLVAEGWEPGDDEEIDPGTATRLDGTVTADLRCGD